MILILSHFRTTLVITEESCVYVCSGPLMLLSMLQGNSEGHYFCTQMTASCPFAHGSLPCGGAPSCLESLFLL